VSDNWSDRPPWSSPGATPPSPPSDPWGVRPAGSPPPSLPPAPPPPGSSWGGRPLSGFPVGPPVNPPGPGGTTPTPKPRSGRGLKAVLAVLTAACLLLAGVTIGLLADRPAQNLGALSPAVTPGSLPDDDPAAAVARALGASVVQIDTDDGLGSGVVYDPTGLILTNAHVVGTTRDLDVHFDDGRTAPGTVLGSDPEADVAVVKVDTPGLTVARLDDDKLAVGQMAIAIGSPFGLDQSVTAGIVSAVDRPLTGNSDITINMIQTDAPINPGNSGGALANRIGEVIGINTLIFSQTGENSGIGFAIPIQTAKAVADKIVKGEPLDHGWLGVSSSPTDDGSGGAQLSDISADSPAEQGGLQVGDVVIGIDDSNVKSPNQLSALVVGHSPGDRITLKIRRGGKEEMVTVTLGKRPASTSTRRRNRPTTTR
jgi:putative serine protease PepD